MDWVMRHNIMTAILDGKGDGGGGGGEGGGGLTFLPAGGCNSP